MRSTPILTGLLTTIMLFLSGCQLPDDPPPPPPRIYLLLVVPPGVAPENIAVRRTEVINYLLSNGLLASPDYLTKDAATADRIVRATLGTEGFQLSIFDTADLRDYDGDLVYLPSDYGYYDTIIFYGAFADGYYYRDRDRGPHRSEPPPPPPRHPPLFHHRHDVDRDRDEPRRNHQPSPDTPRRDDNPRHEPPRHTPPDTGAPPPDSTGQPTEHRRRDRHPTPPDTDTTPRPVPPSDRKALPPGPSSPHPRYEEPRHRDEPRAPSEHSHDEAPRRTEPRREIPAPAPSYTPPPPPAKAEAPKADKSENRPDKQDKEAR